MLKQMLGSAVGKARYKIHQQQQHWQRNRQARIRRSHPQAIILMYHRVGQKDVDPWDLCVTPENFEAHLQVLKQHMQPTSLRELAIAQQNQTLPDRAVAITFDDGYADNLYQAKPLLAKYNIPATVFIATGYTQDHREFWWDALARALLQPGTLPPKLQLALNGEPKTWTLGNATTYSHKQHQADRSLLAWKAPRGSRLHFYHQIWAALQPLPEPQRQTALAEILQWAQTKPHESSHRPMHPEELKQLEAAGLVTIGAHTVNHPALSKQTPQEQQREIADSRAYLEQLLNHSVDTFAYPFGAYQPETVPLLATENFLCACTTVEETAWQGNSRHELPRFDVGNWSGPTFEQTLLRWLEKGYA